jgi:hypothetical protein
MLFYGIESVLRNKYPTVNTVIFLLSINYCCRSLRETIYCCIFLSGRMADVKIEKMDPCQPPDHKGAGDIAGTPVELSGGHFHVPSQSRVALHKSDVAPPDISQQSPTPPPARVVPFVCLGP